ncbi:MAG: class I SAM-dependent methyltransferase, partial [Stellaceae bacterium]
MVSVGITSAIDCKPSRMPTSRSRTVSLILPCSNRPRSAKISAEGPGWPSCADGGKLAAGKSMTGAKYFRAIRRRLFGDSARTEAAAEAGPPVVEVKPLDGPAMRVEVEAAPEQIAAMSAHVANQWRRMGELAPHWSVLVHDDFTPARIAAHQDRFFATGEQFLHQLRMTAARCGVELSAYKSCFELGCGVGRITVWLAREFAEVIAADISPAHLLVAAETLERFGITDVRLACLIG